MKLSNLIKRVSDIYGDSYFTRMYNRTESQIVYWAKDGDTEKLNFWIRKLNAENENYLYLKRFLYESEKSGKRITKKDIIGMKDHLILNY